MGNDDAYKLKKENEELREQLRNQTTTRVEYHYYESEK